MRGSRMHHCLTAAAWLLICVATSAAAQATSAPYASIARDGEGYAGAGRAAASDLRGKILRVGLLVPLQGARKAEGDAMVAAAQRALRDAAAKGVLRGKHVELAIEDESGPAWGVVSDAVIRLMLEDQALVVITSSSGADAHLCEQVGNRMGVPVITLSADATTTQIDIPWIFRIGASDAAQARVLAQDIYDVRHLQDVLIITQQDPDGSAAAVAMRHASSKLGAPALKMLPLDVGDVDIATTVRAIVADPPEAIVIWTNPSTAAELFRSIRAAGLKTLCYFPQNAATEIYATPGVPLLGEVWTFAQGEQTLGAEALSITAAETYDAILLTLRSLQSADANRARVRDALALIRNYKGASGIISFDREGNDTAAIQLVQISGSAQATAEKLSVPHELPR